MPEGIAGWAPKGAVRGTAPKQVAHEQAQGKWRHIIGKQKAASTL